METAAAFCDALCKLRWKRSQTGDGPFSDFSSVDIEDNGVLGHAARRERAPGGSWRTATTREGTEHWASSLSRMQPPSCSPGLRPPPAPGMGPRPNRRGAVSGTGGQGAGESWAVLAGSRGSEQIVCLLLGA